MAEMNPLELQAKLRVQTAVAGTGPQHCTFNYSLQRILLPPKHLGKNTLVTYPRQNEKKGEVKWQYFSPYDTIKDLPKDHKKRIPGYGTLAHAMALQELLALGVAEPEYLIAHGGMTRGRQEHLRAMGLERAVLRQELTIREELEAVMHYAKTLGFQLPENQLQRCA